MEKTKEQKLIYVTTEALVYKDKEFREGQIIKLESFEDVEKLKGKIKKQEKFTKVFTK